MNSNGGPSFLQPQDRAMGRGRGCQIIKEQAQTGFCKYPGPSLVGDEADMLSIDSRRLVTGAGRHDHRSALAARAHFMIPEVIVAALNPAPHLPLGPVCPKIAGARRGTFMLIADFGKAGGHRLFRRATAEILWQRGRQKICNRISGADRSKMLDPECAALCPVHTS